MSHYGNIPKNSPDSAFQSYITIGRVVDTNDPHQMGRLRVLCPAFGDSDRQVISSIAWAMYASPFAGASNISLRGRSDNESQGPVAYGMWNIPKIGSYVLVGCVDGDPGSRFWFAAIYPDFLAHTMPHGRYSFNPDAGGGTPQGPMSSTEAPINPLALNQQEAFTNPTAGVEFNKSFEWRTRAADHQVSFVNPKYIGTPGECDVSKVGDDRNTIFTEEDGNTISHSQGYVKSRLDPTLKYSTTDNINWDSQVYSWTTPGFHAISMDDKATNCRMRFRTAGGHQIILDDTNERIYISTAQGKTWIEIDERGTIDIFSEQDFSVHAKGDINFKTDKAFRVTADQGIHLNSGDEMRLTAVKDLHVHTSQTLRLKSLKEMRLDAQANLHLLTGGAGRFTTGATLNLSSGANMLLSASPNIFLNGPPAQTASPAEQKHAFVPSRIPDHEPYARVYGKKSSGDGDANNQFVPEYDYTSDKVGTGSDERGISLPRNPRWHR